MVNSKINFFKSSERSDYSDFNCHWWQGAFVEEHKHEDYYEIVIATDKTFFNRIDGKIVKQTKGDFIVLKPGSSHSIFTDGTEIPTHYNIAIKKTAFENFFTGKLSRDVIFSDASYIQAKLSEKALSFLLEIIPLVDNEKFENASLAVIETVLHVLAVGLIRADEETSSYKKTTSFVNDAIAKIDNYTYVGRNASDIYELYPVSHTVFIDEFKRLTGKTVINYLAEKKLDYAKMLLKTTDFSVLEISLMAGYDSLSYFIKIFKESFGVTPLKFRKNKGGEIFSKDVF
ncbi:MAG: AraC family transcriptional regulator [Clostridia bacterium]|nr:AraC family transcriptional regulator [Clostridia bacterium]